MRISKMQWSFSSHKVRMEISSQSSPGLRKPTNAQDFASLISSSLLWISTKENQLRKIHALSHSSKNSETLSPESVLPVSSAELSFSLPGSSHTAYGRVRTPGRRMIEQIKKETLEKAEKPRQQVDKTIIVNYSTLFIQINH